MKVENAKPIPRRSLVAAAFMAFAAAPLIAGASLTDGLSSLPPQVTQIPTRGIVSDWTKIVKPAAIDDGYMGGLMIERDTSTLIGGRPGAVNVAQYVHTIVGKQVKAFEWNSLFVLDSYADAGEHCAFYSQANKYGTAGTWAGVFESCDTQGNQGAQVALELDSWVTGPDTGSRVNLDIAVGDSKTIRQLPGGGVAEATAAIRTGASSTTPWARWVNGAVLTAFRETGLTLDSDAVRGLMLRGKYKVGLDTSNAECVTAIRMAPGQRMTFESTDQVRWGFNAGPDGGLVIEWGDREVFRIDSGGSIHITGDIMRNGVKVA